MIDLKKLNYFSGEESAVSKAVHKVCQMHELCGRNVVLFYKDYSSTFSLHHLMSPAHEFFSHGQLSEMLRDPGLMFRVDVVVIHAWDLGAEYLSRVLDDLGGCNADLIIATESYRVVANRDDVAEYTAHSNMVQGKTRNIAGMSIPLKEIRIKSKTDGWSATTEELKASFVRDRRLDDLLGD